MFSLKRTEPTWQTLCINGKPRNIINQMSQSLP
jgi:hypothetical protein